MAEILLLILFAQCAALLLWGMLRPGRIYEFPFLAGAVFAGFVLPQFVGLSHDRSLPPGSLEKAITMTILCAAMCYWGYSRSLRPVRLFAWDMQERQLIWVAACFVIVGAMFRIAIGHLPPELAYTRTWTGLPVFYRFFAELLTYGFAISLLLYTKTGTRAGLVIALLASCFYLEEIFVLGRRGVTIEIALIVLLAFWFQRRWAIPRVAMVSMIFFAALVVNGMGMYREITLNDETPRDLGIIRKVAEVDYLSNTLDVLQKGGPEVRNAIYTIEAVDRQLKFDLGVFHWNTLVFNYVPAQWFGKDFKQSLMIDVDDSAYAVFRYRPPAGSTMTGMADAFGSFWYFGCLKFFLIAFILAKLFRAAVTGHFNAQLLYMLTLVTALHSITHHTQWFFSGWVHMAIFLVPALYIARKTVCAQTHKRYQMYSNA